MYKHSKHDAESLIQTALVGQVMRSVVSVRLSISTLNLILRTNWLRFRFLARIKAIVWVSDGDWKSMSQTHSSRSMQNVGATQAFNAASYEYWLMAAEAGFYCDVISCELAQRGVWRGAVEASGSGPVKLVWVWLPQSVWPRSLIDDS